MDNNCSISDDWKYKGMKVVFMENRFLRIGILVDKGSDIFEFRYKPKDLDPLLRLSKGIRNPLREQTHVPNANGKFEEYYYGGWQETLPNASGLHYKGTLLGQHGEVALVPWKYAITKNSKEKIQLKVWIRLSTLPLLLEKTFTLKKDEIRLSIKEKLTNEGGSSLDIMWGQHIAFGLPFLKEGVKIETNALKFKADPGMEPPRRFLPGKEFLWPYGENSKGVSINASDIQDLTGEVYRDLCYIEGYPKEAFYRLNNAKRNLSFELRWNGDLFKCLWLWEERYASKGFPWWGDCYTLALEPWTSSGIKASDEAVSNGEWLGIKPGEIISTELSAGFTEI